MKNPTTGSNTGSYFRFSDVTDYIRTKTFKFTLADVIERSAKRITINNVEFISTTEAQTFIAPALFRQMECTVICYHDGLEELSWDINKMNQANRHWSQNN